MSTAPKEMIDGPQTLGELRRDSSVTEDLLRRRRQNEALKAKHIKAHKANKIKQRKAHKTGFQSAEGFVQEFRQQDNSRRRFKRVEKMQKRRKQAQSADAPSTVSSADVVASSRKRKRAAAAKKGGGSDESLLLVVRVRSTKGVAKEVAAYFTRLRLHSINSAVFVRLSGTGSKSMRDCLEIIKPYVVFGTPSKRVVRDLIFKRGFARLGNNAPDSKKKARKHTTLSNNSVVEAELGDVGIICLDDIVHEICTVGEYFDRVNRFLMPFSLAAPSAPFKKRILHVDGKGGERDDIDAWVRKTI